MARTQGVGDLIQPGGEGKGLQEEHCTRNATETGTCCSFLVTPGDWASSGSHGMALGSSPPIAVEIIAS